MKTAAQLKEVLKEIDHKSYPAYKSLRGSYRFRDYDLSIDHVQGDPFASPSDLSIRIPIVRAGFPEMYLEKPCTRVALEDIILRKFSKALEQISNKAKGSGKSGAIYTSRPGQTILERSAMSLRDGELTARFCVGFPARGRTIDAGELEKILFRLLPEAVEKTLFYRSFPAEQVKRVYELAEDQQYIRSHLDAWGLVAFLADHSILPRESGVSDLPMRQAVAFASPESLRRTLTLPHKGKISGMGIPKGITLIIGGGFHGKSTLLKSLEQGVYDHIAGDGREYVITDASAMKLRAEDGRAVTNLDISMFIHDLPNGKDTTRFSTEDASGSTSQAAAVMECLEMGSRLMLIDEDTSATNFLVRDEFMQQIVSGEKEPITPFIARVGQISRQLGVSTVLVAGSSGAFFHVADTIIQMDAYVPHDVKDKILPLLERYPAPECMEDKLELPGQERRFWGAERSRGQGHHGRGGDRNERIKIKTMGTDGFSIDHKNVDLRLVEQINSPEQVSALAEMMRYVMSMNMADQSVGRLAETLDQRIEKEGLTAVMQSAAQGLARPRREEIYAMLNRYR